MDIHEQHLGNFNLYDILQIQHEPGSLEFPNSYMPTLYSFPPVDVWLEEGFDGIVYSINHKEEHLSRNGRTEKEWRETLSKLRHDYVAEKSPHSTDMPLTALGINSILTPDCVDPESRKVLELSTNASNYARSLSESWLSKRIAYEDLLKNNDVDYYILLVGREVIQTNCSLSEDIVSSLCFRLNVALDLESKISNITGYTLNASEEDEIKKKEVENVLEEIRQMKLRESRGFKKTLISDSLRCNTEVEDMHVSHIVRNCLAKASRGQEGATYKSIQNYIDEMRSKGTRGDNKRVSNIPSILPFRTIMDFHKQSWLGNNVDCPIEIYNLLSQAMSSNREKNMSFDMKARLVRSISEAQTGVSSTIPHNVRKSSEFDSFLDDLDLDRIALSGPGAKLRAHLQDVIGKKEFSKLGFDPETDTSDISIYHKSQDWKQLLTSEENTRLDKENLPISVQTTYEAKCSMNEESYSLKLKKWVDKLPIVKQAEFVSEFCMELSYEYKIPHKMRRWSIKKLPNYDVWILFKCTGTHVFSILLYQKESSINLNMEKVGPQVYETENFMVSDWMSFSEVSLEHLVKSGPYVSGISCYLLKHFGVNVLNIEPSVPSQYFETLNLMTLLFYNNKADSEELVTSNRYLQMRVLQIFEPNPYDFVERFPSVMRSRLTVYLLKRTISMMNFYDKSPPYSKTIKMTKKKPLGNDEEDELPDFQANKKVIYLRLRCLFHDSPVSIEQLVDSFYFGYVVSKTKGRAGDRSYKIVSKICKEHFWFKENIIDKDVMLWELRKEPKRHCWDPALLRTLIDYWIEGKESKHGSSFLTQVKKAIYIGLSRITFLDIATLKASSKYHEKEWLIDVGKFKINKKKRSARKRIREIREANEHLQGKRPRVMTSLARLIRHYIKVTNDRSPTYMKVLTLSLQELNRRGWIYSDIFPKDQHGGDREIHVIEIRARVIHYVVEEISRIIGKWFTTDSVMNPKEKDVYCLKHEKIASAIVGDHVTVGKSADATKWCQRHHVSKFFFALARIVKDAAIVSLMYHFFCLWTTKRIALPEELIAILESNRESKGRKLNENISKLTDAFWEGKDPFVKVSTNMIEIEDGMFQGLPHGSSSIIHDCIQEPMNIWASLQLEELGIKNVCSVIQGSDDSAMLISIERIDDKREQAKRLKAVYSCLKWKEEVAKYLSIWTSEAKSSIGTLNLIEYNSEWWYYGKYIRPTFRWVSASLSVLLTESFQERVQNFYNLLTTCLENGGQTLMCGMLQLSQSDLHYKILGMDNHILGEMMKESILQTCHPAGGYFPLEDDLYAGVPGFDFTLYRLSRENKMRADFADLNLTSPGASVEYEGKVDKGLRSSLRSVEIKFSNLRLHEAVVAEVGLMPLNRAVERLCSRPENIYKQGDDWSIIESKFVLKLFDRGVKSSLSNYQPAIRSAAASSYLFNRPCMSLSDRLTKVPSLVLNKDGKLVRKKFTLYQVQRFLKKSMINSKKHLEECFPRHTDYEEFYNFIIPWIEKARFLASSISSRGKVMLKVWQGKQAMDHSLIDIVRRQWFSHYTIKASRTVFREMWKRTKVRYPFLEDKHEDTANKLDLDAIQLHNFISSIDLKERKLALTDTTAKRGELDSVLSRTHWPNMKVLNPLGHGLNEQYTLMNDLYLICSSPMKKESKEKAVHYTLKDSYLNNVTLSELPRKMRRLKIISDYLRTEDTNSTILDMEKEKMGTVGFFLQRQKPREVKTMVESKLKREVIYEGEGEWRGRINGISTILKIEGQTCKEIIVHHFEDIISQGASLKALIKEFNFEPPEEKYYSKARVFLNSNGYLISDSGTVSNSIPITKEFDMPEITEIIENEGIWKIEVSGNNIQLRMPIIGERKRFRTKLVTILHHMLSPVDWRGMPFSRQLPSNISNLLEKWFNAERLPVSSLAHDLGIDRNWERLGTLISQLGKNVGKLTHADLDIDEFTRMFTSAVRSKIISNDNVVVSLLNDYRKAFSMQEGQTSKETFVKNFKMSEEQMKLILEPTSSASWLSENLETLELGQESHDVEDSSDEESVENSQTSQERIVLEGGSDKMLENTTFTNFLGININEQTISHIKEAFIGQELAFSTQEELDMKLRSNEPASQSFFQGWYDSLWLEPDSLKLNELREKGDFEAMSRARYHSNLGILVSLLVRQRTSLHSEEIYDHEKATWGGPLSPTTALLGASDPSKMKKEEVEELLGNLGETHRIYSKPSSNTDYMIERLENLKVMIPESKGPLQQLIIKEIELIEDELTYRKKLLEKGHYVSTTYMKDDFLNTLVDYLIMKGSQLNIGWSSDIESRRMELCIYSMNNLESLKGMPGLTPTRVLQAEVSIQNNVLGEHFIDLMACGIGENIKICDQSRPQKVLYETGFPHFPTSITFLDSVPNLAY